MHVLEHLPNPVEYLQNLRDKFLEPGGWLLLEVPNLYAHDCFEVAHLVSFSAHTLSQVVRKAGFRVIQLRPTDCLVPELIPLYLTLLAQPDSSTPYYSPTGSQWSVSNARLASSAVDLPSDYSPRRAWIPIERHL